MPGGLLCCMGVVCALGILPAGSRCWCSFGQFGRFGTVCGQSLEKRGDVILAMVAQEVKNRMTAPAAAVMDGPRAVVGDHQAVNRDLQPGGKSLQRVEVDFVRGAQGFQLCRVNACGLLHGGKCRILLTKHPLTWE